MNLMNATLSSVCFFAVSKFYVFFYVYVYVLYELFFIDNVVRMLFYVNMCTCHVYFTITLPTYYD